MQELEGQLWLLGSAPTIDQPAVADDITNGFAVRVTPGGVEAARSCCPSVAPGRFRGNDQAAPPGVSAGQDRPSDEYPRPDSNRRYRLERATEGLTDNVDD